MLRKRAAFFASAILCAACAGPIAAPAPASGELIAFGGGASGARNACFTCHGFEGEGEGTAPRLAGLSSGYLAKQLDDYARQWRPDSTMTPIAALMSDGDRLAVAGYYAGLPAPDAAGDSQGRLALYHRGDAARGLLACASCHGEGGEGRGPANPALAGQPAAYTAEQLQRWKRSVRRNDARDVMGASARALSEEEIEDLARYIERM